MQTLCKLPLTASDPQTSNIRNICAPLLLHSKAFPKRNLRNHAAGLKPLNPNVFNCPLGVEVVFRDAPLQREDLFTRMSSEDLKRHHAGSARSHRGVSDAIVSKSEYESVKTQLDAANKQITAVRLSFSLRSMHY